MSDETSDVQTQVTTLQSQVSSLEAKVSAIQEQLGKLQTPNASGAGDDDDGDISFPVGGTGP
jgi:hypothetical protein